MPGSYPDGKDEIKEYVYNNFPKETKILDVGPGRGIYGILLREKFTIDCVEIFPRYITDYGLNQIYNEVFVGNILNFDYSKYDLIIMGDVLEHLSLKDAQKLIDDICEKNIKVIVAVPYNYEQGEWEGNIYETHLQPDLTTENMKDKYPNLSILFNYPHYGYYINTNVMKIELAIEMLKSKGYKILKPVTEFKEI